jgi:hypothetical protein
LEAILPAPSTISSRAVSDLDGVESSRTFGRRIVLGIRKRTPALPREVSPSVKQSPVRSRAYRASRVPVGHFDKFNSAVTSATHAPWRVAALAQQPGRNRDGWLHLDVDATSTAVVANHSALSTIPAAGVARLKCQGFEERSGSRCGCCRYTIEPKVTPKRSLRMHC